VPIFSATRVQDLVLVQYKAGVVRVDFRPNSGTLKPKQHLEIYAWEEGREPGLSGLIILGLRFFSMIVLGAWFGEDFVCIP